VLRSKLTAAQRRMSHEDREGDIYQQEQIAKAQVALLKGEIEAVTPCRLC
jgi:hypothetical protein